MIILIIAIMVIIIIIVIIIYCHFMISSRFTFQHQLKVINSNIRANKRLRMNRYFRISRPKSAISINIILLVLQIFHLYKSCRFKFVTPVHSMNFPLTINDSQATDKTPTSRKSKVCERAERAIKLLEIFCIFTFKNCYFFQYLFWYFRY